MDFSTGFKVLKTGNQETEACHIQGYEYLSKDKNTKGIQFLAH